MTMEGFVLQDQIAMPKIWCYKIPFVFADVMTCMYICMHFFLMCVLSFA